MISLITTMKSLVQSRYKIIKETQHIAKIRKSNEAMSLLHKHKTFMQMHMQMNTYADKRRDIAVMRRHLDSRLDIIRDDFYRHLVIGRSEA